MRRYNGAMSDATQSERDTERAMLARFVMPGSPAARPLATFLAGQMGSGKTSAMAELAKRLPEGEAHVVIDGDAIAQMHPRYAMIEATSGTREAQSKTLAFASQWQRRLIDHARDIGAHLTIEVAPARTDVRALAFEQEISGYDTKLSILAVPEHESRQAIFKRLANEVAERGAGREVSIADHDATYAEWPATLAKIHAEGGVGGIEVLSNNRAAGPRAQVLATWSRLQDGSYAGPGETPVTTLTRERTRPLAAAERFTHSRRWADLAKAGIPQAKALQQDDEARLKEPQSQRLRRELRLAGNADARLNGTGRPSDALVSHLKVTQSALAVAAATVPFRDASRRSSTFAR